MNKHIGMSNYINRITCAGNRAYASDRMYFSLTRAERDSQHCLSALVYKLRLCQFNKFLPSNPFSIFYMELIIVYSLFVVLLTETSV